MASDRSQAERSRGIVPLGVGLLLSVASPVAHAGLGALQREQERSFELVEISPHRGAILVDLAAVQVTFRRPLHGLMGQELAVNGSRASRVTGSGVGPYTFTGFEQPDKGGAVVRLVSGRRGPSHAVSFEGATWTYRIVDPNDDDDQDGLPGVVEREQLHSDPAKADSDGDGLPDPYEVAHHCLSPIVHETFPTLRDGTVVPGLDDIDHDGTENREEFLRGTNPCDPLSRPWERAGVSW